MKKIILFMLLSLSAKLYCQDSTLLFMCQEALKNNMQIKQAEENYISAKKYYTASFFQYMPMFILEGDSSFYKMDFKKLREEKTEFVIPDYYSANGTVYQKIPGGAELRVTPVYDSNNTAGVSVYYSQSLFPYWLKFGAKNPDLYSGKLQKKMAAENLEMSKHEILDAMIQYFINYRDLRNRINLAEEKLELYRQVAENYSVINRSGEGSYQDYFTAQQNSYGAAMELKGLAVQRELLEKEILDFINTQGVTKESSFFFEKILTENNWAENFKNEYEWNYEQTISSVIEQVKINTAYMDSNFLKLRQNLSPSLTLSADCYVEKEGNHSFDVSVGLNLSQLFSPEKLTYRSEYKRKKKLQNEINEITITSLLDSKKNKEKELDVLKEKLIYLNEQKDFIENYYKDSIQLYAERQMSALEFTQIKIAVKEVENNEKHLKDLINYYQLLLNFNVE